MSNYRSLLFIVRKLKGWGWIIISFLAGLFYAKKGIYHHFLNAKDEIAKREMFYVILVQWLRLRQRGISIENYFSERNIKTIAIYGMKELGQLLYEELKDSSIRVKYAIDRNADNICAPINVVTANENMESVDMIVITAVHCFDDIKAQLKSKVDCPIFSLEEIVFSLN